MSYEALASRVYNGATTAPEREAYKAQTTKINQKLGLRNHDYMGHADEALKSTAKANNSRHDAIKGAGVGALAGAAASLSRRAKRLAIGGVIGGAVGGAIGAINHRRNRNDAIQKGTNVKRFVEEARQH